MTNTTRRILCINGNPDPADSFFDRHVDGLARSLSARAEVASLVLRDLNIKYCTGCWGCWVKTPGECTARDDSAAVCREFIRADLIVFASPVRMGFTSALLKKAVDKLIPLLHPYFYLAAGEYHHLKRYPRYPQHALVMEKHAGVDDEDVAIIRGCYERLALNFHGRFRGLFFTDQSPEAIADALNLD